MSTTKSAAGTLFSEEIPHESASKHVSGLAEYTDDILEPNGILYGAIGWSDKAHALIKKIDLPFGWAIY